RELGGRIRAGGGGAPGGEEAARGARLLPRGVRHRELREGAARLRDGHLGGRPSAARQERRPNHEGRRDKRDERGHNRDREATRDGWRVAPGGDVWLSPRPRGFP